MKKLFPTLFVLTLVIVLPAISWYYLQSGVSWRKEAMGELQNFGSVKDLVLEPINRFPYRLGEKVGSSFIVHRSACDNPEELARIAKIVDQFDNRPDVEFIIIGKDCLKNVDVKLFSIPTVLLSSCTENPDLCNKINQTVFGQSKNNEGIAFIDGRGIIRRYYNTDNLSEWQRLVEHISMMLPDERKQYGRENKKK